ncbi:ABC transporter permease [Micrococcales bacterium 31B]|nr:ABC transporter permease [Micrococcales bacterium 31B]
MLKYLGGRALRYLVMIWLATSITYLLAVSTFNPGQRMSERTPKPTQEMIQTQLSAYGLDPTQNAFERYWNWMTGVLTRFDWGRSPSGGPITDQFLTRAEVSIRLMLVAVVLSILIGVSLGVFTASRQYKLSDRAITGFSYLTFILPAPAAYLIVQNLALSINEASGKTWLYVTSPYEPNLHGWDHFVSILTHLVVPTVALILVQFASYQVGQRQYLLDNLNQDFVRMARATGLRKHVAIRRHALRVSFIPTAQSIAFSIPGAFLGAILAEITFNWNGIGRWTLDSMVQQDVNAAAAISAYGSLAFAIGAVMADVATVLVDPRTRGRAGIR